MKLFSIILTIVISPFLIVQDDDFKNSALRGEDIYKKKCMLCHKKNGEGSPNLFPPLANSDFLVNNRNESISAIKFGQTGKIMVNNIEYNGIMPVSNLNDQEIADVMNYILTSWGNESKKMVTIEDVQRLVK